MQGRNLSPKHNPSTSSHAGSAAHTPQQWFRPSLNRSVPNLAKSQHQNRSLGFSSIRDLARTSRRPLATLSANISQAPSHTVRASSSLYGTLRDQCSPPPPPPTPELPAPSAAVVRRSQSSSTNSFTITPDNSGLSTVSSHPTTPSPAKPLAFLDLRSSDLPPKNMGNKASSIIKKPLSIRGKPSVARLDGEKEKEPSESSTNDSEKKQPATFSPRGSPAVVRVPQRRSSLTVLHLDNSHFDTPDPAQPTDLQHRASALSDSLERRPSTLAETIRPVISNVSTLTPLNVAQNRGTTLSPPLLSPTSQISSVSSQAPSMIPSPVKTRSSVIGSRIHLPKTFPDGSDPVPIPTPPITNTHRCCYTDHKRIIPSNNIHCPVPCMGCSANAEKMWMCTHCLFRICPACMAVFDGKSRSLQGLLDWLAKGKYKDEEGMKEVVTEGEGVGDLTTQEKDGNEAKTKEDVEKDMEELALKKVETTRKRETR